MNSLRLGGKTSPAELRALLRQQFPEAHAQPRLEDSARFETGCRELDNIGIARGSVTEIVQTRPSSGGALLIARLVEGAAARGYHLALIDGRDSFDPENLTAATLHHLLWLRTSSAAETIKAADLLLRDGNLPLVLIDLALNPEAETRRLPNTSWNRLRALADQASTALLAITRVQTVPRPHLRIILQESFTLAAFERTRSDITITLHTARSTPAHLTKTA
jgi:hypothetical protein